MSVRNTARSGEEKEGNRGFQRKEKRTTGSLTTLVQGTMYETRKASKVKGQNGISINGQRESGATQGRKGQEK